jgi:hypothetical protein
MWDGLDWLGILARFCEDGNEILGYLKAGIFELLSYH